MPSLVTGSSLVKIAKKRAMKVSYRGFDYSVMMSHGLILQPVNFQRRKSIQKEPNQMRKIKRIQFQVMNERKRLTMEMRKCGKK